MGNSLRRVLAESHIGAVAITLLIAWALRDLLYALLAPTQHLLIFIGTAIAILDVPAQPSPWEVRIVLLHFTELLVISVTEFATAWLLSRIVYRAGPFKVLRIARNELKGNQK